MKTACRRYLQNQQRRFRSNTPYRSPEYPWATEPPVITKITAAEASVGKPSQVVEAIPKSVFNFFASKPEEAQQLTSTISNSIRKALGMHNDPFDDENTLTDSQKRCIEESQKTLPTKLSPNLEPITKTVPKYIPGSKFHPPENLDTFTTTLSNGLRVVSHETAGPVTTLGIVSNLGSRTEHVTGCTHLLELVAFGSSSKYPDGLAAAQIAQWGGAPLANTGREQSLHCLDLWRPHVPEAVQLLSNVFLEPNFDDIGYAQQAMYFQSLPEHCMDQLMTEAVQQAAFGNDQQLGKRHYCPTEEIGNLTSQAVYEHWKTHTIDNPQGLILGAVGVNHDELVELAETHFGQLKQTTSTQLIVPSTYRGGECRMQLPPASSTAESDGISETEREKRLTRVAVALPVGGWHSKDFVPICVLQSLLGGGSSFSAGGPGKGMYTRLYRAILNQYMWAESAEAFTNFHHEIGLMGIMGSVPAPRAGDMVKLLCQHLVWLAQKPVNHEELSRAKNMLKANVLMQLESRLVQFEDVSRQVLTYGKYEPMGETARRIDAVTAADVQNLAQRAILQPVTLAAVGMDLSAVPPHSELAGWLQT